MLAPLRDLPEPWKRQLRQGFRKGVHVYRPIPVARMIGLRLAALSPGLKARLVHRCIAYERPSEPGLALSLARAAPAGAYRTAPEAAFPLLGRRFAGLAPRPLSPAPGDLLLRPPAGPLPEARRPALRALERRGCVVAERGTVAGATLPVWFRALLPS